MGKRLADRDVRILAEKTLPHLLKTRTKYQALAREVYEAALTAAVPGAEPVPVPQLREFTIDEWEGALKKRLQLTDPEGEILPVNQKQVDSAKKGADLHARNAERDHAVAYSIDDPFAVGWARYDPIPKTCPWCLLQISRGPIFHSRKTATAGREDWHAGCTCEAVQVFKNKPYRGQAQYERMMRIYKDSPGKNSREKVKNFRATVSDTKFAYSQEQK